MTRFSATTVVLLLCVMQVPGCTAQAPSWQQTLERVRQLSDAIFDRLEDTRSLLTSRAGNDHVLLARLSAAPAIPRASGYGLLPEIRADAPIGIGAYLYGDRTRFARGQIDDVEIRSLGRLEQVRQSAPE